MFTCSYCHKTNLIRHIEKEAGEYMARCSHCQAKNILALTRINEQLVPTVEVRGYWH